PWASAAKAGPTPTPLGFEVGSDPIQLGLVASLRRPGGNITGATQLVQEVTPKMLELLHELLPRRTSWRSLSTQPLPILRRPTQVRCWRQLTPLGWTSMSSMPAANVTSRVSWQR